jgi:hypothetical protein
MQKIKDNGIRHPLLFSAHYIREIYFVCLFIAFFVRVHFVFGLLPFLKKWGEFQEIRMMSLSLCLT